MLEDQNEVTFPKANTGSYMEYREVSQATEDPAQAIMEVDEGYSND